MTRDSFGRQAAIAATGAVLALTGFSCASSAEINRYDAEYSAWKLALLWTHRWYPAPGQERFETLELIVDPSKRDQDLAIDGQVVISEYHHGETVRCARAHRVDGTLRLLEIGGARVKARLDARLHCPGAEPVPLKGDFTYDVKTPP